ncbi:hypothetical protein B0T14DRAFT_576691 [Immersiella caudata]|uniref:Uncharacterized protein n=1 Tax=Immersiella caudata TaxID=314043 RepID=A0AA40CD95_9PEZI|nr:hypothetical protein B0T14DRAFT_576691 [Immersiella caudata]
MILPIRTLTSLTADLTPSQKAQLDEVVSLMLEIYQTLVRMRYLSPINIQQGPHDLPPSILSLYVSLNLDPRIIYLYSVLPYIDPERAQGLGFFGGGEFTDFRTEGDVVQGRDPMYSEQPEERMRPWMTPLSCIGNHNTALIYDARKHEVGIYGQIACGSIDKNLREGWDGEYDEDDEEPGDENMWDDMEARSAPSVLGDIVRWYRELKELPGGEKDGFQWEEEIIKPLYIKHGWPGEDFDGDAFLVDKARDYAAWCEKKGY